jgi:hypothetical protein
MPGRSWYGVDETGVLLVGESPNRSIVDRPHRALMRPDLAELAGVGFPKEFFHLWARTNVLNRCLGEDEFPMALARPRAAMLAAATLPGFDVVVMLGRRVEAAFDLARSEWFEWRRPWDEWGPMVAVAPHPSKRSRWWNLPTNVERARQFWRKLGEYARTIREVRRARADDASPAAAGEARRRATCSDVAVARA